MEVIRLYLSVGTRGILQETLDNSSNDTFDTTAWSLAAIEVSFRTKQPTHIVMRMRHQVDLQTYICPGGPDWGVVYGFAVYDEIAVMLDLQNGAVTVSNVGIPNDISFSILEIEISVEERLSCSGSVCVPQQFVVAETNELEIAR